MGCCIVWPGEGRNYVTSSLMACHSEWNRGRSVKPHCICHFWCLKSFYGMILGGYVKFFENFEFRKKKNSFWNWGKNFEIFFSKKNCNKILIFYQNWILYAFCFHLMCILCMFVKNYDFSKIDAAKAKIFQR